MSYWYIDLIDCLNYSSKITSQQSWFAICLIIIVWSVWLFSNYYLGTQHTTNVVIILLVIFVSSIICLICNNRPMTLCVGWDGLGLSSYFLVIHYSSTTALSSGTVTVLLNRLGDVALLWWLTTRIITFRLRTGWVELTLVLILMAITKSAQVPFSSWLPIAMIAPTPVSALVHRRTLVTAGVWVIIQTFRALSTEVIVTLGLLSTMTIFVAGLMALIESDLKRVVALSTLSQLGFIMCRLRMGLPRLCLLHLLAHAILKASLFIVVGAWIHSTFRRQDCRIISLTGPRRITLSIIGITCLIGLCGLGYTRAFVTKELVLETGMTTRLSLYIILTTYSRVLLTSSYCLRLGQALTRVSTTIVRVLSTHTSLPLLICRLPTVILGVCLGLWLEFNLVCIGPVVIDQLKFLTISLILLGWLVWLIGKETIPIVSNILGLNWIVSQSASYFSSKQSYRGDLGVFKLSQQVIFWPNISITMLSSMTIGNWTTLVGIFSIWCLLLW